MKSHPINPQAVTRSILFERPGHRALILFLSAVAAVLGVCAPFAQKNFIDGLLAGNLQVYWIGLAFLLTLAAQVMVQVAVWMANHESFVSQKSMSEAAYSRILEGPGGLVGRRPAGEAVSTFAVDISGASMLLSDSLAMFAALFFPIAVAPIVLHAYYDIPWWASGFALGTLILVNFALALRQARFFIRFKSLAAERTGLVAEWVQNLRTLRILGWVDAVESRIFEVRARETANRKTMVTNGQVMNSIAGSSAFVLNIFAVLLLTEIRQASGGSPPSPGELLSLLWILGVFLARPIRQIPWIFVMSMDAITSAKRLQNALMIPVSRPIVANTGEKEISSADQNLALDVRGLRLDSDGKPLLADINLSVKKGEFVAVVGEVGAGKSLLLQSLIGATSAQFRGFFLDGVSTSGPGDAEVRSRFAFIPQEGFTMSASLRENVVFDYLDQGVLGVDDSEVIDSLVSAQFVPSRERIYDGLDTDIGERGVNLSGGQRQRIGLARARYSKRRIVLMDDCLSAVDIDTEKRLIDQLICGYWKNHSRILVTHRLTVLPSCDRILFMEEGTIAMQGTYSQLLEGSERFREFVRREAVKGEHSAT
jgi:ATP-binding cassette subfamily B multidrug efflux pump